MQTIAPIGTPVGIEIPRKIWTREEAHALAELGLPWIEKLELINGDLIDRMGKRPPHVYWKTVIRQWLDRVFSGDHVRSEDPIDIAPEDNLTSEPEPDLVVTKTSIRISAENPTPADVSLVIEISDSRVRFDLGVKAPLYARAGILEYWVVNIPDKLLIVHREPREGRYTSVMQYNWDETVCPLAAPDKAFCLDRL